MSAEYGPPPSGVPAPECIHAIHGRPSAVWRYRDETGALLFAVARYDLSDGKQVIPWSWNNNRMTWVPHGYPTRPLYGLWKLPDAPNKPVLVVEGEKSADAAQRLCEGAYIVVTWQGGAAAAAKASWNSLVGHNVLLWPDRDEAGRKAMEAIATLLLEQAKGDGTVVKVLDVSGDEGWGDGWDAADAEAEGWDYQLFLSWGKQRVHIFEPPGKPETSESDAKPNLKVDLRGFWEAMGLSLTKRGPTMNDHNVERYLDYIKAPIWFDTFTGRCQTEWTWDDDYKAVRSTVRDWEDNDYGALQIHLQRHVGLSTIARDTTRRTLDTYARCLRRNTPKEWLERLKWDGAPRLDGLFPKYFKTADTDYARRAGANFVKAMVARILTPGCKADTMPVLVGKQGIGKSRGLQALGGKWYGEAPGMSSVEQKDFYLALQGKMLVEISELAALSRSDAEAVKRMLSCATDTFRKPYERISGDFPRTCVFAGTTNNQSFLEDPTGARRFWPVVCIGIVDVEGLGRDRDQIFAEAVARARETWWEMPETETQDAQEDARLTDAWLPSIEAEIQEQTFVTVAQIAYDVLGITKRDLHLPVQRRIAACLRSLGWQEARLRRDGVQARGWTPPSPVPLNEDVSQPQA